jgi:hypothetical protein
MEEINQAWEIVGASRNKWYLTAQIVVGYKLQPFKQTAGTPDICANREVLVMSSDFLRRSLHPRRQTFSAISG